MQLKPRQVLQYALTCDGKPLDVFANDTQAFANAAMCDLDEVHYRDNDTLRGAYRGVNVSFRIHANRQDCVRVVPRGIPDTRTVRQCVVIDVQHIAPTCVVTVSPAEFWRNDLYLARSVIVQHNGAHYPARVVMYRARGDAMQVTIDVQLPARADTRDLAEV